MQFKGFSVLDTVVALAISAILATLAYSSYQSHIEKSDFQSMLEVASRFALNQQRHRMGFSTYASKVDATGQENNNTLIFPDADQYKFKVDKNQTNIQQFVATVTPIAPAHSSFQQQCRSIRVTSEQGVLSYRTISQTGGDTTSQCLPHE
ncbi:MAG TPA: hypothetical protein VFX23_15250 [Limnobacter sp.]|uniref:type IV pilin protein n=1 Tax=Limnobacter sp. TaxID=2003368 RepID=UPI002E35EA31|nr:hypothetical protein [Limnobacter sp.]HEX5487342.1 hypothetical protein [Limnobacter sp.]